MATFAIFCVALGVLVPVAIMGVSGLLWSSDTGNGHGYVGSLFLLLVLGVPAMGFGLLMLIVGFVTGGFAAAQHPGVAASPASLPVVERPNGISSNEVRPQRRVLAPGPWPTPSWLVLLPALIWSAPLGFVTFLCVVTEDYLDACVFLLIWLVPIAAAYGLQLFFTRRAA